VQSIAAQKGMSHPVIDQTVDRIDAALLRNGEQSERLAA